MGKLIGVTTTLGLAGFTAWLFWGPLRLFFFSLIPATAEYAWVGKLIVTVLIAWFGGLALPFIILICGLLITFGVIGR